MKILGIAALAAGFAAAALPSAAQARPPHHGGHRSSHASVYVGMPGGHGYRSYGYSPYASAYQPYASAYQPYAYGPSPYAYGPSPYAYGYPPSYGGGYYGMSRHQRKHIRRQQHHQRDHMLYGGS